MLGRENRKQKHLSGSMTLEAAMIIPLYMFVLLALYSTIDMMRLQGEFQMRLTQIGKEIALYSAANDLLEEDTGEEDISVAENVLGVMYAQTAFQNSFSEEYLERMGVRNDSRGISFLRSGFFAEEDIVDLVITYEMEPLCNFGGWSDFLLVNRCRMKAWTGYECGETSDNSERMVYVTETGSVYHLSRSCTYLSLSIVAVKYEDLENYANADGSSYRFCALCDYEPGATVFITSFGDCYHASLTCSGLRRTISVIPISQVGERGACSRCGR